MRVTVGKQRQDGGYGWDEAVKYTDLKGKGELPHLQLKLPALIRENRIDYNRNIKYRIAWKVIE